VHQLTGGGLPLFASLQGFMGPNYSISTACATANYAFVAAANHIRKGDCDVVVVSPVISQHECQLVELFNQHTWGDTLTPY
jgi:3-oxoacyl-(acyl-carrier-protein) synthase